MGLTAAWWNVAGRYAVAAAATALAVALRLALVPVLGSDGVPFFTLFPVFVVLAAWFGLGPALISLALGTLGVAYFLFPPQNSWAVDDPHGAAIVAGNLLLGAACALMGDALGRWRRREAASHLAARQSEAELAGMFGASSVGMAQADSTTRRLARVNPAFCAITGYTADELLSKTIDELCDPEYRQEDLRLYESLASSGQYTIERPYRRKDGSLVWVEATGNILYDLSGRPDKLFIAVQDITNRKGAEEALHRSEERYRAIIDQAVAGIAEVNCEGQFVGVNDRYCSMVGYSRAELLGRSMREVTHPDDLAGNLELLQRAVADGQPFEIEKRYVRRDGSQLWVHNSVYPIRDLAGVTRSVVAMSVDITARKEAEDRLARESDRLRLVTDSLPVLISYVDSEGRYQFNNKGYKEWFGSSQEDVRGKHMRVVLGEAAYERLRPYVEQALRGRRVQFDATIPYRDGGPRHVHAEYVPDMRSDGSVAGYFALIADISERKRAEEALRESEERLRLATEAGKVGLWEWDIGANHVIWTESLYAIHGLKPEEFSGTVEAFAELIHPDDRGRVTNSIQAALRTDDEPYETTFRAVKPNGEVIWLFTNAVVIRLNGQPTRMHGATTDVTELKRAEEALREADRRKDEFLATLAHELRNPLAPIRNSLHILRLAGGAAAQHGVLDMMERQVSHMVRLVDDLLEVSRITRGKIDLRKELVELAPVLQSAVEEAGPAAAAAGHRLTVEQPAEPIVIEADPVRMAQVFANLLNNAVKYTERGGQITLSARREGDEVVVSVRDTGTGIPAEMLPRVFDLFTQVDRTLGRAQGGLGIGLALVKRLVELHGGSVEVQSEGPGLGSEFIVRLPQPANAPPAGDGHAGKNRSANLNLAGCPILIVDDNRDAADSLAAVLKLLGAEVNTAYDGQSALAAIRLHQPAVVFLDIGMPGMDGYAVAAEIRRDPQLQDVRLVALTGWGQAEDRRRSLDAGFHHHLVKPPDTQAIVELLAAERAKRPKFAAMN